MTQREIETELSSLRTQILQLTQRDEARRARWKPLAKGVTFVCLLYIAAAMGFLATSAPVASKSLSQLTLQDALMFIIAGTPLTFLAQAIREPR
jgi:hypothetical protein